MVWERETPLSKKSPTVGPTERTPKPGYLIALSNLLKGPLGRSHSNGTFDFNMVFFRSLLAENYPIVYQHHPVLLVLLGAALVVTKG